MRSSRRPTANEELRLKYRYLDLRRPDMHENICSAATSVAKLARDYFDENGFIEIETPMLIKLDAGGRARLSRSLAACIPARSTRCRSRHSFTSSFLMVAGFDRYIQLARCFRDEDLRADRQPEFTQIDMEMSFADETDDSCRS